MYVKKVIKRKNPDLELPEEQELENTFLIQAFQKYLRGKALQWFKEEQLGEKTFKEIALQFKEKFSKPNTAEDSALITEAHQISQAAKTLQPFSEEGNKTEQENSNKMLIDSNREIAKLTSELAQVILPTRYDEESPGESSTDISDAVPWRYNKSYPGQSLGLPRNTLTPAAESLEIDNSRRGAVPLAPKRFNASSRQVIALTTDQLAVNAATHRTEKTQPKPKNTAGIDKGKSKAKKTTIGDEQLKILADAATRQLQENANHTTRRTLAEAENPRVVELGDDKQPLPSQTQPTNIEMMTDFTREEFKRMLPQLQPHLERLRLQNNSSNAVPAAERKPQHVLEKIRATNKYHVPPFKIRQHLKNNTIQITLVEPAFAAKLEREYGESDQSCRSLAQPRASRNTTIWNDTASPKESVPNTLGYISGYLSSHHTDAILLDGGSVINLAKPIRLANDKIAHVTKFVMLEVMGRTAVIDITPSPRHTERIEDHGKDTAEVIADLAEPEYKELIYVDNDAKIENEACVAEEQPSSNNNITRASFQRNEGAAALRASSALDHLVSSIHCATFLPLQNAKANCELSPAKTELFANTQTPDAQGACSSPDQLQAAETSPPQTQPLSQPNLNPTQSDSPSAKTPTPKQEASDRKESETQAPKLQARLINHTPEANWDYPPT
ncbi:ribonuclease H [Fusarium phyllophilum]|uniref:Ribonuclease H n=1 Tax=Fusarium phyllophilum TaxID=47803 RepID=A0A8H5JZN7_9HYPO|nr:ribonuclease H [Fusarium phyllophilum]